MIRSLIALFVYFIVIAILVGLAHYVADEFAPGKPLGRFIKVAATVIGVLVVALLLLDFAGVADFGDLRLAPAPRP